jgi:hypothetical protein
MSTYSLPFFVFGKGPTPNMLMLGRETNQPADLMFGEGQEKIYSGNDEYVMGL